MYKYFKKHTIGLISIVILLFVIFVYKKADAEGLVPCDTNCDFPAFMLLIKNIIKFLLFNISIPFAAICFTWAGYLYLFTGVSDKKSQAKKIFWNVLIGLTIALAAWLIVKFVLSSLGYNTNPKSTSDFPTYYTP